MLALDRLSKTYADGTAALADVTLTVRPSEIVALIGGSGCGKTTLLRLVAGLDVPTRGGASLDGTAITGPHPSVGIVFQEPRLLPWLRVADNVGFGLPPGSPGAKAQIAHALEKVGLAEHAGRWPKDLSGGQQQRVAIARAFVTEPKLLLLDEPFSALDAFTRAGLHEHLLGLWEETKPMVVLVTHDVGEAVALADRAFVMRPRPGRIDDEIALGLPRPRRRASPAFESATRRLLESLDRSLKGPDKAGAKQVEPAAHWW